MVPAHQVRVGAPSRGAKVDKPPSVPRPGRKGRVCEAVVPPVFSLSLSPKPLFPILQTARSYFRKMEEKLTV